MNIVRKIIGTFVSKRTPARMPTLEELNQQNRRKNWRLRKQFLENRRQIETPNRLPKKKRAAAT